MSSTMALIMCNMLPSHLFIFICFTESGASGEHTHTHSSIISIIKVTLTIIQYCGLFLQERELEETATHTHKTLIESVCRNDIVVGH